MSDCTNLIKAIDAYLAKADEDLTEALDEAGFVRPEATVKEINSLENKIATALKGETRYVRAKIRESVDLEAFAADWLDIKDGDDIDEALSKIFLDEFQEQMPKLASAYIKQIDSALAVTTMTQRTVTWAESWSKELGEKMKLASHEEIERILTDTLKEGKSVAEFTHELMDSGIRDEYHRARAAALTETLRAHSVAQQEALVQNPAATKKEWVHTGSHRNTPRENHVAMNGVQVPIDEPFELEGAIKPDGTGGGIYYPMYPRDSNLPPGESVNCHCIHRAIVDEDILGLPLEERQRLQQQAIDEDDGEWEKELDRQNRARAGIEE